MIKTEFIIIGQGICGTFLSWYLQQAGRHFIMIDHYDPSSSSQVAAGIINPVTGRRIVKTWMIGEILPFALNAYEQLGRHLGIEAIARKTMIDFFPSAQMLNAFIERVRHDDEYLTLLKDATLFNHQFSYEFGHGEIDPCYIVNLKELLSSWRHLLKNQKVLLEDRFNENELRISHDKIVYKDVSAERIIFCDGIYSSTRSYFKNLPFALNKGEALIIECDIPDNYIFKKGITVAPLGNRLFWAGSSHEWNFTDNQPSENFLKKTTNILSQWLKVPFNVVHHVASIRPATLERRPFAGIHPHFSRIGILNGMGTKGCSLSPYFADQFVNHLTNNSAILPEADIKRFSRILNSSI
ncbi:MAG TPA: FAD-binding oxidoreductase [Flavitalea sp.]|nr:FAD-binding oxidoreductase [Flavitalea sp.]